MMRIFIGLVLSLLWAVNSWAQGTSAQEWIKSFETVITVETSGDIIVTETIDVISAGNDIKRGIFRELPRYYTFMGVRQAYEYELLNVTRDGEVENIFVSEQDNAVLWRLGQRDVLLDNGPHRYVIMYRVADQARRHEDKDEIFWNSTGHHSVFPIETARTVINFPEGATIIEAQAYTGRLGSEEQAYTSDRQTRSITFETSRVLLPKEGLTVAVSIQKGVIAPLSEGRKQQLFWIRHGAMILLIGGGLLLLGFYLMIWTRVGRDPSRPPVFPRYAPPEGYSAAAIHYIHHKRHKGQEALSALVMQLGSEGVIHVEADKKVTTLTRLKEPEHKDGKLLLKSLFPKRDDKVVMDGKPDKVLFKGAMKFLSGISKAYGADYYKRNVGWALLGIVASLGLVGFVMASPVSKNGPVIVSLFIALAAMNLLFLYLLPAPTRYGAKLSSEIAGFKLYLETAEKDRINTANPLGEEPPLMSADLYERFMPFAIALGVEKPWTKQFEKTLPREAKDYRPSYASGSEISSIGGRGSAPVDFGQTIAKAMTAGVAAAAPISQSSGSGGFSSGSGGGGFSGGGGGGGGVGGW